jgi:uncharacterized protein (TIGR03435 family)
MKDKGIVTKSISILVLGSFAGVGAQAQPAAAPMFDVASVKVSQFGRMGGEGSRRETIAPEPGSLTMRNVRLQAIIGWAYQVADFEVTGPGWLNDERYDIIAKAGSPVPVEDMRPMLQTLLAERFKVELHRQTKETSIYALVVGKGGPKLQESTDDGPQSLGGAKMRAEARNTTMAQLAGALQHEIHLPVMDMTGLKGKYNFSLDLMPYVGEPQQHLPGEPPPDAASIISQAFSDQLGLRLEPRKAPLEMVVVDHAEKVPVEN